MSPGLLWSLIYKDPLIILATIVMGSISVILSYFDPDGVLTDRVARLWARTVLRIAGVRVRVRGREWIDPSTPYVFVGNHLSLMDTPVVLAHIPVRFLFLVNSKYVRLPFLGTHLRRCGHFSVQPDDVRASLRIMTEAAEVIRRRGLSILVFPEGSRARGDMEPFKEGAAYIAIKAGVPVLPFALWGTREVLPIGSVHIRSGTVDLVFGPPIPTEGLALKDRTELTRQMQQRVASLLPQLKFPRSVDAAVTTGNYGSLDQTRLQPQ